MDLLETYIEEMKHDLTFDELNLKQYQYNLPALKHKWVGRCMRHKAELHKLKKDQNTLRNACIEELRANSKVELSDVALKAKINKQQAMIDMDNRIEELQLIIELLEKSEKTFNSTTWDVKNITDIQKLETL